MMPRRIVIYLQSHNDHICFLNLISIILNDRRRLGHYKYVSGKAITSKDTLVQRPPPPPPTPSLEYRCFQFGWHLTKIDSHVLKNWKCVECAKKKWSDSQSNHLGCPQTYKNQIHLSRQHNCGSLRCSWSIVSRRYSNYIFIRDLTPGFSGSDKDNCKTRRKPIKLWYLARLISELWLLFKWIYARLCRMNLTQIR